MSQLAALGTRNSRAHSAVDGPLAELLGVAQQLRTLQETDWVSVLAGESKEIVQVVEQIMRTAKGLQVGVLAAAESSGKWALDGQRNFSTWVTDQTGSTKSTAGRDVRLATTLRDDLPRTREALANGSISTDHAQIIARQCTKTDAHRKRLADPDHGEQALLDQARQMDATKFTRLAKAWAIETDPEAAERDWRHTTAKEELSLTAGNDGYVLSGFFNHVHGALLDEALRARMGRKPADDTRSYNERRAEAFVALARNALDSGALQPTARIRPHLTVTVEYETLQALIDASASAMPGIEAGGVGQCASTEAQWAEGWRAGEDHVISSRLNYELLTGLKPAELPDGTPLPHQVLSRLACDSMLTRVIFGPESRVLNVGREQRIFTTAQTQAIIARDRVCQYPGCDESSNFSEIHHSISWAKHQGNTDVDLGILLCYHHHTLVHARDISILRRSGKWIFLNRYGNRILPPQHTALNEQHTERPHQAAGSSPGKHGDNPTSPVRTPDRQLSASRPPSSSRSAASSRSATSSRPAASSRPDFSSRPPSRSRSNAPPTKLSDSPSAEVLASSTLHAGTASSAPSSTVADSSATETSTQLW